MIGPAFKCGTIAIDIRSLQIAIIRNAAGTQDFKFIAPAATRQLMPLIVFSWSNGPHCPHGLN